MSDPKDEINVLFDRRSDDRLTFWPMSEDARLGHPWDICTCGHSRQNHGFKGSVDFGKGCCTCLSDGMNDPIDPQPKTRSCRCRRFVLAKEGRES